MAARVDRLVRRTGMRVPHEFGLAQALRCYREGGLDSFRLTNEAAVDGVEVQFKRATTQRGTEIVLISTDDDAPIRFDEAKPATGAQILEDTLHIKHLDFPFRAIRTARV